MSNTNSKVLTTSSTKYAKPSKKQQDDDDDDDKPRKPKASYGKVDPKLADPVAYWKNKIDDAREAHRQRLDEGIARLRHAEDKFTHPVEVIQAAKKGRAY